MRFEVHPFKDVEEARKWAEEQIDTSVGKARSRYITTVPGQEATYSAKYAEAKQYLLDPEPDLEQYPWIKREAQAGGVLPQICAEIIKRRVDVWNFEAGPEIEAVRLAGKRGLTTQASIQQVVNFVRAIQVALDKI